MEKLIEVAEEQIKHLEEIQYSEVLDVNHIEISKEIRSWCRFILKLNSAPKQVSESNVSIKSKDKKVDRFNCPLE